MIIGLTGGIATGKSESAKHFKELGAYTIDADAISRELTKKGKPALKELVKYFGKNILRAHGALDRRKLAEIIFTDKEAKLKVEKILHAYIISRINEIISEKIKKYDIVINAPLLFEVGLDRICDIIIVIWAPYNIQARRLAKRDGLNKEQVEKRISSQMPIEEKVKMADYTIDNTGSRKALAKRVRDLYALLTAEKK
ncbi:MAG: dephospho-CoA kinase [Endomicrobia bacterium]|nr:dephospho-CoA kinase [Endomicrobiia bacterium]MCL2798959.1 dephospho-CoA kinase [Endomicrobiia bacterium]